MTLVLEAQTGSDARATVSVALRPVNAATSRENISSTGAS